MGNILDNSTILDVICEMESALKRIPHDIQLIADTAVKKQEGRQSRQSHKEKIVYFIFIE